MTENAALQRKTVMSRLRRPIAVFLASRWASLTSAIVGLLLLGGFLGHVLTPPTVVGGPVLELPNVEATQNLDPASVLMPDVIGLDQSIASRALRDAGIDAELTVNSRPAAGQGGLVVDQSPAPGMTPTGKVQLTVSTAAKMPNLVGKKSEVARRVLEELGAVVTIARMVRPQQRPGLVVDTKPAAGTDLADTVVLQVSDPGESIGLAQLSTVEESRCQIVSSASVDGHTVRESPTCYPERGEPSYVSWNLARKAVILTALLGNEDSDETTTGHVRIMGDGKVLMERDITFGTSSEIRVDVSGVLRLRIEATASADSGPTIVFGDLAAIGRPEDLAALEDLQ